MSARRLSPNPKPKIFSIGSNNSILNPKLSLFTIKNRFLASASGADIRSSATVPANSAKNENNDEIQKTNDKKDTTEVTNKWENTKRLLMLIRAEMKLMLGALAALAVSSGTTLLFPAAIGRVRD